MSLANIPIANISHSVLRVFEKHVFHQSSFLLPHRKNEKNLTNKSKKPQTKANKQQQNNPTYLTGTCLIKARKATK